MYLYTYESGFQGRWMVGEGLAWERSEDTRYKNQFYEIKVKIFLYLISILASATFE